MARAGALVTTVMLQTPWEAAVGLESESDPVIASVLAQLPARQARGILGHLDASRRGRVTAAIDPELRAQWLVDETWPEGSVGSLMTSPSGTFRPESTVAEAIETLRRGAARPEIITYGYVTDQAGVLLGVLVMRDLLLAPRDAPLRDVMQPEPFSLAPETSIAEAMRQTASRHYPVYPVCEALGRLVGLVRGTVLFEQQAFQILVQAGSMVGVQREESVTTPWRSALGLRNPWLLLNLLTVFVAGAVVSAFQHTIDRAVALAVFLPVLAGQAGNTGAQALAVTLRGMATGQLERVNGVSLATREAALGALNGFIVGLIASAAMLALVLTTHAEDAVPLATAVFGAMVASCVIGGVAGALVPLVLRRFGADPATASTIILTTITDVISMALLLGSAAWLLR
jgi:magnesium transporter